MRHEGGRSNSKTGRDVGMPESTVRNSIKHAGEIREKCKFASAFCGLRTSTKNTSVKVIGIQRLLTVWIGDCNQKRIRLAEQ